MLRYYVLINNVQLSSLSIELCEAAWRDSRQHTEQSVLPEHFYAPLPHTSP